MSKLIDKRIEFDGPERLAVLKHSAQGSRRWKVAGYVVANSLRDGIRVALEQGYRGTFSVVLEGNVLDLYGPEVFGNWAK